MYTNLVLLELSIHVLVQLQKPIYINMQVGLQIYIEIVQ